MITLRAARPHVAAERRGAWWPLVAAAMATYGSFAGVLLSLRYAADVSSVSSPGLRTSPERIVLVVPRAAKHVTERVPATVREQPVAMPRAPRAVGPVRPDTGTDRPSSASSSTGSTSSPAAALSLDATSRLARPRPDVGAWIAVPGARDPFAPPTVPTAVQRESVLTALSTMVPDLAARRVPTRAELDSGAKEATLKMRLAGRPLLVPPDNSAGLITVRIPLPRGLSTAARARAQRAHDEGRERLLRLLARVDSLRRARDDSLRAATLAVP